MAIQRLLTAVAATLVIGPSGPITVGGQVPPFRVLEPEVVIGTQPGEELARVLDVARSPEGDVFVLQGLPQSVRRYTEGRLRQVIGGPGEGPAEFTRPISLTRVADSLFIMDMGNRRISVFGLDGQLHRDTPARAPFAVREAERFSDGRWIFRRQGRFGRGAKRLARDTIPYYVADEAFETPTLAIEVPGPWGIHFLFGGEPRSSFVSLTPRPAVATWGLCAYLLTGDDPNVRVVTSDGSVVGTFPFPGSPPRPVDSEVRRTHIEGLLSRFPDPAERERRRPLYLRDQPYLDDLPISSGLVVDALGFVWIPEYGPEHPRTTSLVILDPALEYLGRLSLSTPLEIVEVGSDYVLGIAVDEVAQELVQVRELERLSDPPPPAPAPCRPPVVTNSVRAHRSRVLSDPVPHLERAGAVAERRGA